MKRLVFGKRYLVIWHDTIAVEQWCDINDIERKAKECAWKHETVGKYVGTFHDYVVLAATVNDAKDMMPYANIAFIPKGVVKSATLIV